MADIIKPQGKKIIKDNFDDDTYNEIVPEVTEYSNLSGGNIMESGTIGGWRIRTDEMVSSNGVVGLGSEVTSGTDWRFWAGSSTPASAPFRVDEDGNLVATSATISGTITVGSFPSLPSDDGLLSYWNFDEGSGSVATDYASAGNDGVITSATYVVGVSGTALEFDGLTGNVRVPDATAIQDIWDGGGALSVWVNPNSGGEATTSRIFDKDKPVAGGWLVWVSNEAGGKLKFNFRQKFTVTKGTWTTDDLVLTIGANNHITISYNSDSDANNPVITVNGEVVTTTETDIPDGTRQTDVGNDLYIGNVTNDNRTFDGWIDEPRLYNHELSLLEAQGLYLNPSGVQQQGVASDRGLLGGWTINPTTIANGTNIILDAGNKALFLNDTTFGNQGIQLEYNGGTPRAYIGDGGSNFLEFDGTTLNVSGTIAVGSFPGLPSDDDLLGYWSLDEGSGSTVSDYSSADNAGTITGGTFVVGVSGTALDFNGVSQYVDLGASIVVGTMSVSMWVNFDDITRTEFMMIGTDTDTKNWFYLSKGAGNLSYGWRYDDAGVDKRENFAYSGLISNDTWHHFVAVVDSVGGTHKFYIDGVEANTATSTYTVGVVESPTYISRDNATQAMDGTIDEVRIYDRVLTVNEVKALYLNPNGIQQQGVASDRGLIAGWTINSTTLSNGTNIILDASNKAISINDATYGNSGVQIEYNAGTPRMYIGDGSTKFFEFDGTNAIVGGDSFISLTSADDIQFRANNELVNKVFRGNANDGLTEAGTEVIRYPLDTYIRDGRIYSGQINRVETWSMDMQYTVVAETDSLTAQDVFLGLISQAVTTVPANSTSTARHIGFMIEDGTLYASVADGTTQTKSAAITGYTLTDEIAYRISWDNGTNARFYVKARGTTDYTLEATLSSNIPSGTGADDPQVLMGISGSAGARSMIINNNYLIIDAI